MNSEKKTWKSRISKYLVWVLFFLIGVCVNLQINREVPIDRYESQIMMLKASVEKYRSLADSLHRTVWSKDAKIDSLNRLEEKIKYIRIENKSSYDEKFKSIQNMSNDSVVKFVRDELNRLWPD
jgi:hypothetical protein